MNRQTKAPPTEDKRWRLVDATMRRHGNRSAALIETLHTVQEVFGYLDEGALRYVAASLRVPLSKIYGVATFYHFFTLKPQGRHTCAVCLGTACYIKGAQALLDALKQRYGIASGQTTDDQKLSLVTARCVGACGIAPAASLDGDVLGKLTPDELVNRIEEATRHDA
ncbi:MAG: bidirectional hydrogenase complex protein HoxE [Kiritimatiellae bacterium]|nr:bidirectional hydrogenase complex protein HoxE [Kiritimatiellia bacterium]MCO5062238.1 bidirectional hydrogenase complex protein HoxE [Kiritimatiellia bacterium]MCO5067202.1 bidirectional hydrogenase complex protein HoxE [Kiritimatiellia bacterium]MCO6399621.1 bidirectional hydrogenase complex protein HoxE [Verrucomicrobiota bacterium]